MSRRSDPVKIQKYCVKHFLFSQLYRIQIPVHRPRPRLPALCRFLWSSCGEPQQTGSSQSVRILSSHHCQFKSKCFTTAAQEEWDVCYWACWWVDSSATPVCLSKYPRVALMHPCECVYQCKYQSVYLLHILSTGSLHHMSFMMHPLKGFACPSCLKVGRESVNHYNVGNIQKLYFVPCIAAARKSSHFQRQRFELKCFPPHVQWTAGSLYMWPCEMHPLPLPWESVWVWVIWSDISKSM